MCTKEYKEKFSEVKKLIEKRKQSILEKLPVIHKIEDGIIIRFFSTWENKENTKIKTKNIKSQDSDKDLIYLAYIPKNSYFDVEKHTYKETIITLDGQLELNIDGKLKILESFSKLSIKAQTKHSGKALKDTYLIVIGRK